jgi:hypothetical protein
MYENSTWRRWTFAGHHDMINAFPAGRTDQPFRGFRFAKVNEQASGDLDLTRRMNISPYPLSRSLIR